ncbi:uncharacterized protein B0P05DRAFT_268158 [Gilbertella persicaria]|uniref:uncharacterized protein n=1 Tax=Gilbertella persicaria TaxID=101096 RepID=UPI00221EFE8A|nr:uncharacterized protein B0P05DRAFT_268158 [Gilbertella persicaria]KAI8059918.1 hypothetical protein B0P05DRAFT_268158 [Gilbertella persicaria]
MTAGMPYLPRPQGFSPIPAPLMPYGPPSGFPHGPPPGFPNGSRPLYPNNNLQPLVQPSISPYGASLVANVPTGPSNRTIYLGNVNTDLTPHDILKCVHQGAIETFRITKERLCAFLTFIDPSAAAMFFQTYTTKKFVVKGVELKVGWGTPSALSPVLRLQIEAGATRTVYLGRLTDKDTEETLRARLKTFGMIEFIRIIRDINTAFVHFLSILSAVKCNSSLALDPDWKEKTVGYGRDHCTDVFTQYNFSLGIPPVRPNNKNQPVVETHIDADATSSVLRTLYIGNIHPEATCEDICNVLKGGNVLQIKYQKDTQNAFVSFVDEDAAQRVKDFLEKYQITVRGRKLRIGWGKPSTISPRVAFAIKNGATRNLYIGGIDPEVYTVDKLRTDFSDYGEVEQVNLIAAKKTGFVNFMSINNAMTALAAIKMKPEYADIKISYGKDRCGNKPKITIAMERKAAKREEKLTNTENKEVEEKDSRKEEGQKVEEKDAKKEQGQKAEEEEAKKEQGQKAEEEEAKKEQGSKSRRRRS